MSWARYDDEFPMNKKVGKLVSLGQSGVAAIGLHLLANTYARHNGTSGVIEAHVPNLIAGPGGKKLARLLESVGMFDLRDDGAWMIHDYDEYHDPNDPEPNRSAADRKKEISEKRAKAGRRGGLAKSKHSSSKATLLLEAKGVAKPWQNPSPDPVPDPVPTTSRLDTSSHHQHGADETKTEQVVNAIIDLRIAARMKQEPPIGNANAYKLECIKTFEAAETVERFVDDYPDAPVSLIAGSIQDGTTRNLIPYAIELEPDEQSDEPTLTREQREALLGRNHLRAVPDTSETA